MRNRAWTFLPVVLLMLPGPARAAGRQALEDALALQEAIQQAIERAEPSIACILVSRSDAYSRWGAGPSPAAPGRLGSFDSQKLLQTTFATDERRRLIQEHDLSLPDTVPESYGSGVLIDESGLVLTNAHVVRGATKVYVRLPGGKGSWADIHAADPRSDFAVLRLLRPPQGLKALKFGDGGKIRKGQFVISLSNPFAAGFRDGSPSASWGIVSNLRRRAPGNPNEMERSRVTLHHFGTLIQTDNRVNLGCSGGALLNLEGELIGLTTALAALRGSETPGGFAVPIDASMRRIIERLQKGQEVEYGFLGVQLNPDPGRAGAGVPVLGIAPGSPAAKAGLLAGDVILSINRTPVHENEDLFLHLGKELRGTEVRIEVSRNGRRQELTARLAKYYVPGKVIAANRPPPAAGLRVDYLCTLTQRIRIRPYHQPYKEGVVVREVVPDSPADKAHLQVDRVITRVNNQEVRTPADFYAAMSRARGPVELTVLSSEGSPERVTLATR